MRRWFRAYVGTATDPKFGEIALVAECSRSVALATWQALLEDCAATDDGGRFTATARRLAVILGEPPAAIERVLAEMRAMGMIDGDRVAAWSRRQYEGDGSAERVRRHRAGKAAAARAGADADAGSDSGEPRDEAAPAAPPFDAACNGDVTLHRRYVTPPEAESETDSESPPAPARACAGEAGSGGGDLEAACRAALGASAPPPAAADFAMIAGLLEAGYAADDVLSACRDWAADPAARPMRRWKSLIGWARSARDRRVARAPPAAGPARPSAARAQPLTLADGVLRHASRQSARHASRQRDLRDSPPEPHDAAALRG